MIKTIELREELLGEYAYIRHKHKNVSHVFNNLLAALYHFEHLKMVGALENHPEKEELMRTNSMCRKLIIAYRGLLNDFLDFREKEMTTHTSQTASVYVEVMYLKLRGEPLE